MTGSFTPTKGPEEEIVCLIFHVVFLEAILRTEIAMCDNKGHWTKTKAMCKKQKHVKDRGNTIYMLT